MTDHGFDKRTVYLLGISSTMISFQIVDICPGNVIYIKLAASRCCCE